MNTIAPRLRSTIPGAITWATFTMPITLTFSTRGQSAGVSVRTSVGSMRSGPQPRRGLVTGVFMTV